MWSLGAGSRMRYGTDAITAMHGFYVQLVDFAARLEERGAILATVCPGNRKTKKKTNNNYPNIHDIRNRMLARRGWHIIFGWKKQHCALYR